MKEIDYARALTRGWWIVLLMIVIALGVTALVTARQDVVYESSAMLVVAPTSETNDPGDVMKSLETLERRTVIATFARIPGTLELREAVGRQLKIAAAPYRIHGSVVPNTNIIRIAAEGPKPDVVAAVANTAAELTTREARSLYRVYTMRLLARATPPRKPRSPDPQRNYLVGAAVGALLGIAAALAADRARD